MSDEIEISRYHISDTSYGSDEKHFFFDMEKKLHYLSI